MICVLDCEICRRCNIILKTKENDMKKEKFKLYDTTLSQDLPILQTKYTLYKRIINIVMSATSNSPLDYDTMLQALNLAVQRNDCARLRFVKRKGKIKQYVLPEYKYTHMIRKEFDTKAEQDRFIEKETHKAVKYMKGEVIVPYFIHTYDNKDMVLLKVCHINFDLYGLNIFYKDLFEVYYALQNRTQLPKCPASFEDVIVRDLKHKFDTEYHEKNREFFDEYLRARSQPYYAGLNGRKGKHYDKMVRKGWHSMRMFFIKNDTQGYMHDIPDTLSAKLMEYCRQNKVSPANYLLFAFSVVQARLNDVYNLMPLELCNCRGTMAEKLASGTKVQSLACYTEVKPQLTFEQNLKEFCQNQTLLYRHIGFSDTAFQMMSHKIYNSPLIGTFYSLTFSFIPMVVPDGISFQIYSNGKCALPAYVAVVYDVKTETMKIVYDCQTQLMDGEDVKHFHSLLMDTLTTVLNDPMTLIKDLDIQ